MAFKVLQLVNGLAMLSNPAANRHTGYWALVTWLICTGMCCSVKYLLYFKDLGTCLVIQWLKTSCQCGSHEFDPWSGKIPYATEQLSPCTTIRAFALYLCTLTTGVIAHHIHRPCPHWRGGNYSGFVYWGFGIYLNDKPFRIWLIIDWFHYYHHFNSAQWIV